MEDLEGLSFSSESWVFIVACDGLVLDGKFRRVWISRIEFGTWRVVFKHRIWRVVFKHRIWRVVFKRRIWSVELGHLDVNC